MIIRPNAPVRRALRRTAGVLALFLSVSATGCAEGLPPVTASPYGAFMAGTYAAQTGDNAAAAHYFAAALEKDPDNPLLLGQSFITALLAGSPQAVTFAARLPGDPLAQMVRANAAVENGRWLAAAKHFASVPAQGMTGLVRPLLMAWSEAGDAEYGSAIARLKRASQGSAFGPIYLLNAAMIADMAGREAEAAQLYALVRGAFAAPNLRLAQALASFDARDGHPERADMILTRMVAAHPDLQLALPALERNASKPMISTARQGLAEAYLTLAGTIDRQQDAVLRRILLAFALRLRPDLSAARMLQASIEVRDGKKAEAAATLATIGPDDPLYAAALLQRGQLLADLGKGRTVLPALDALAKAHPHSPAPLALAADIRRGEGDYKVAIQLYTAAISRVGMPLPSAAWSLYYGRAIAEDKAGQWPAAEGDLHHALALDPGQPFVLNYLGYSYALRGIHLSKAQAMIERALSVAPNEGAIVDSLGYVLLRQGKVERAMREQIRAVRLAPTDPEVNAHLADIFAAAGDHLAAQHQWERALSLNPSPEERAKIKARLKRSATAAGL